MDIFRPSLVDPSGLPVLVYFHGGGWICADKSYYDGICARLSENGLLTFNVNYRLAPKVRLPAQLQDAACAISWIYQNAARYGGDNKRIFLAGDSAGAQISSWYASALEKQVLFERAGILGSVPPVHLQGLLLFYGVYDFDTVQNTRFPFIKIYTRNCLGSGTKDFAKKSELASPAKHVSKNLPPIFLCAGQRDRLFSQSLKYAEILGNKGVDCRVYFFSEKYRASHGFLFFPWSKPAKMTFAAIGEYFRSLT